MQNLVNVLRLRYCDRKEGIDDEEQAAEYQIEADLGVFVIVPTTFAMIVIIMMMVRVTFLAEK